jgi:hypothetical protein
MEERRRIFTREIVQPWLTVRRISTYTGDKKNWVSGCDIDCRLEIAEI